MDLEVEEHNSWAVIFDSDPCAPYYGRLTMLVDLRKSFAAALVYYGYEINTGDEAQLEESKQLLIQAYDALARYDSDNEKDLLASVENLMAHGWNGEFMMSQEENENVVCTIPEERGVIWVDNLCIPSSASPEQKLAKEMFMDYLLRADIGANGFIDELGITLISTGENESQDISSIDAVRALLAENPISLENPVWAYSLVVEVLGQRAGRIILCRYRSHIPSQEDWGGESAYYKNVGIRLSIGAQQIADGKATVIGVSPSEQAMPTQDLINELDKRDINVEEEIIETGSLS